MNLLLQVTLKKAEAAITEFQVAASYQLYRQWDWALYRKDYYGFIMVKVQWSGLSFIKEKELEEKGSKCFGMN